MNWNQTGHECTEAGIFSRDTYIPCGQPAAVVVWHDKDQRAYPMCLGCGDHNVRNRGGRLIAHIIQAKPSTAPRQPSTLTTRQLVIAQHCVEQDPARVKLIEDEMQKFSRHSLDDLGGWEFQTLAREAQEMLRVRGLL